MNDKIICFGMEKKILFDLKGLLVEDDDIKKRYFYNEKEKIEVDIINNGYLSYLKGFLKEKNNMFLFEEINDDNIQYVNKYLKDNLVIYEKDNRSVKKNYVKGMVYLKQLEKITFSDISIMLYRLLILKRKQYMFNDCYVIAGYANKDKVIADVVLKILHNFSYVQDSSLLILTLCVNKEFDKDELIYFEDPLREYLKTESKLIIKQLTNKDFKEKIFFFISGIQK